MFVVYEMNDNVRQNFHLAKKKALRFKLFYLNELDCF